VHDVQTFFRVQDDITEIIEKILLVHLASPFPSTTIIVEGDGYVLYGERKKWTYGKTLRLSWGNQDIRASDEKWLFVFDPTVKPKNEQTP